MFSYVPVMVAIGINIAVGLLGYGLDGYDFGLGGEEFGSG
jgi:hypothetical protein